jgi:hypothetical protein
MYTGGMAIRHVYWREANPTRPQEERRSVPSTERTLSIVVRLDDCDQLSRQEERNHTRKEGESDPSENSEEAQVLFRPQLIRHVYRENSDQGRIRRKAITGV